jgi:16S rRNA (cytosine967-C5)-methyltransferase
MTGGRGPGPARRTADDPARRTAYDPARRTAYNAVLAVDVDAAYANLLLPRLSRAAGLAGRDAAFATELCYGTLRWQGVLDPVIAAGARRDVDRLDPPLRAALRLGAYQLLHTRVPAHAAVHATTELVRQVAGERVVGLANAVLRRVSERTWVEWVAELAPADELGRLAFESGYPRWVVAALHDALGADAAELPAALAEDRPTTHLVARPGRISRDELLAAAGSGATAGSWSPYAVRLDGGDPGAIESVRIGAAGVQDEGSQLAALALVRAPLTGLDRDWLDMCAGPGGKAALLAGLLPPGGRLVAADVQPHRAGLVARALQGAPAIGVVADGLRPAWPPGRFDRVLLDAPCTGLGALRRRPEVRWRRRPEDVDRLADLQRRLLGAALDSCRPGGVVGYVTCSPHRAETRDVVAAVRAGRPGVTLLDARAAFPDMPALGDGPDVQLWPHRHGTDAMYVALLHKALPAERDRL